MGVNDTDRSAPYRPDAHTAAGSEAPGTGEIRVEIGELALDGFHGDPDRVLAAFEAELARLVRERGVPLAADGQPHALDALAGLPPLPATISAGRLGEALARSVHAGLSGEGEEPAPIPGGHGARDLGGHHVRGPSGNGGRR